MEAGEKGEQRGGEQMPWQEKACTNWTKVWMQSRQGTRAFHVAGVKVSRGKVWIVGPLQRGKCQVLENFISQTKEFRLSGH